VNWENLVHQLALLLAKKHVYGLFTALIILVVGIYLARRTSRAISRISHLDTQQKIVFQKFSSYLLIAIVIAAALNQMGFDLKVLLGAAGVLTVAVGFAAQTSASNVISGLFLMIDRPFVIGDVIEVSGNRGEILSIDLLSTKIRTFDNVLVRVPNETMVKSDIRNLTFFPIRRMDFKFGVAYKENIKQVHQLLLDIASRNPLCLEDPAPLFIFDGFGDSSLNIQFSVWTLRQNMTTMQNSLLQEIKTAFDRAGIEIPYPHRTIIQVEPATGPPSPTDPSSRSRSIRTWSERAGQPPE
jgi:small-conductance mechanosensitive channel